MKEAIKITIKGCSGYCPVDMAYIDKLIITQDSIRYEYTPMMECSTNTSQKWTYKTNSPAFNQLFKEAALAKEEIMNWNEIPYCTDIGDTEFVINYSDKTNAKRRFRLSGDDFKDCFSIIRQMIPGCEQIPAVLMTSEDYANVE